MQALKALLIFTLLYRSRQDIPPLRIIDLEQGLKIRGWGSCNTAKDCYEMEHPAWERIQMQVRDAKMNPNFTFPHWSIMSWKTVTGPTLCSAHEACKCFPAGSSQPWGCSSTPNNHCEKD